MDQTATNQAIGKIQKIALPIGIVGLILAGVGFATNQAQFFESYLIAFLFWVGISVGSLAWLMLHHLVGGRWGYVSRRIFEASSRTIGLMLFLFVPILIGIQELYEWSHEGMVAQDTILQNKAGYLNVKAFTIRTMVYFFIWMALAGWLTCWSRKQDETGNEALNYRMRFVSGLGVVIYALTSTFASFDWVMSLEPHWFSSMMGPLFMVSQGLTTLAFTILILRYLSKRPPISEVIQPPQFHNIGNLTFAFVILWCYMSFAQFIIVWSGNLPEEITWYLDRSGGGWPMVAVILTIFHFALPFFILLSRHAKLKSGILVKVAFAILLVRFIDLYWWVSPTFRASTEVHWLDFVIPLGIGGVWIWLFCVNLKRVSVLPLHDPRFKEEEA